MSLKRNSKAALYLATAAAGAMWFSQTAFASYDIGQITLYDLNTGVPGRGACIQMSALLPTNGFACVEYPNLFELMNGLLLNAFEFGKTCRVTWVAVDSSGYAVIQDAQCY